VHQSLRLHPCQGSTQQSLCAPPLSARRRHSNGNRRSKKGNMRPKHADWLCPTSMYGVTQESGVTTPLLNQALGGSFSYNAAAAAEARQWQLLTAIGAAPYFVQACHTFRASSSQNKEMRPRQGLEPLARVYRRRPKTAAATRRLCAEAADSLSRLGSQSCKSKSLEKGTVSFSVATPSSPSFMRSSVRGASPNTGAPI